MPLNPHPTSDEVTALWISYQAGLDKCLASGYEEYGPKFERDRRIVIAALKMVAGMLTVAELSRDVLK